MTAQGIFAEHEGVKCLLDADIAYKHVFLNLCSFWNPLAWVLWAGL